MRPLRSWCLPPPNSPGCQVLSSLGLLTPPLSGLRKWPSRKRGKWAGSQRLPVPGSDSARLLFQQKKNKQESIPSFCSSLLKFGENQLFLQSSKQTVSIPLKQSACHDHLLICTMQQSVSRGVQHKCLTEKPVAALKRGCWWRKPTGVLSCAQALWEVGPHPRSARTLTHILDSQ